MNAELIHDATRQEELAANLVHDVFVTMLSSEVWPDQESAAEVAHPVMGAIFFAGDWTGAVLVELEAALAFHLTANLMSVPEPSRVDSDVRDAIGELVNMIAGNLKSMLPGGAGMSMPAIVEGSQFALTVVGSNQSTRIPFATPDGRFSLTLVQTLRA